MSFLFGRKQGPQLKLRNADTVERLTPLAEGHAVFLPDWQGENANAFCKRDGFSISARVRKTWTRDWCRDSASFFVCDKFAMVAVLDGYKEEGDSYSSRISIRLLELCRERIDELPGNPDARSLLISSTDVVPSIFSGICNESGTTAIVALLLKNGRYSIASIGDVAAYAIMHGFAARLLDYTRIQDPRSFSSGTLSVGHIGQLHLRPDDYAKARHRIIASIRMNGMDPTKVESTEGILERGDRLVLASNGISKNLKILVDDNGIVKDVSGNVDLTRLLSGIGEVEQATMRIMRKIRWRTAWTKNVGDGRWPVKDHGIVMPSEDDK